MSLFQLPSELYQRKSTEKTNFRHDNQQLSVLKQYFDPFYKSVSAQHAEKKGIYIHGPPGSGKTMMMDECLFPLFSARVERTHFQKFMQGVHARHHELKQKTPREDVMPQIIDEIASRVDVFCFDEFYVTDIADAMVLKRMFSGLFEAGVFIIMTSNRPPNTLYKGGINRELFMPFLDDLENYCFIVEMPSTSTDYRQYNAFTASSLTIFQQVEKSDTKALATLFEQVLGKEAASTAQPDFFNVMGRSIMMPQVVNKKALKTNFSFLFNSSKFGPADYIAICNRYDKVFIDHVPQLTNKDLETVRRFIQFIDEAYQHKTKLFMTMHCPIKQLFKLDDDHVVVNQDDMLFYKASSDKSDEKFSYKRILSRLHEMQSNEYLDSSHRSA